MPPSPPPRLTLTTTSAGAAPALATLAATVPPPRLVLFTASPDPATGKPWCPDCARSISGVRAAAAALSAGLVEVELTRAEWKNPAAPSPLRSEYGLSGIPSLGLVGDEGNVTSVLGPELEAAGGNDAAEALVKKWVEGQE